MVFKKIINDPYKVVDEMIDSNDIRNDLMNIDEIEKQEFSMPKAQVLDFPALRMMENKNSNL